MVEFISNTVQVHIAAWVESEGEYKYLALKRAKTNPLYPSIWQAVTGTIEENETAIECALREVEEETGLAAKEIWTIPFVAVFFDPYKNAINASPVFGVLVDYRPQVQISNEHEAYQWLSLEEFIDLMVLPSHKVGAEYFWRFILSRADKTMFRYKQRPNL